MIYILAFLNYYNYKENTKQETVKNLTYKHTRFKKKIWFI